MTAISLAPAPQPSPLPAPPAPLLEQLRLLARQRGHCEESVAAFTAWARRFILSWFAPAKATKIASSCCPNRHAQTSNSSSIGGANYTSATWPVAWLV